MSDDVGLEPPDLVITPGGLAPDGETWEERGQRIVAAAEQAIKEARVTEQVVGSLCDQGVALLLERGDTATDRVLVTIKGIRPYGGSIDQLRKSLSRMTREARGFRVVGADEATSVRQAAGAPEGWPEYPVPEGWQVSPRGISKLERQREATFATTVAHEPIFVVGLRVDVGTGRENLVLGYRRSGTWRRVAVPREQAKDARGLIELAGAGLPVSSDTSRGLVQWIDAAEAAAGSALDAERCTTRTGWHGKVYVAGPGGAIELEDPDESKCGWGPSGTWEGYLEAFDVIEHEPAPWLCLFAAATAPLLPWLSLGHCPIVDLWGPRGRGKTTALRFAGSGWGRSDDADGSTIHTWDASPTSIERTAARTWDAPFLLDDTRRARRPGDVTSALYALAQGRGRGRGTISGTQRTSTWRLVAISTGEAPLVEATEAGGARARVLSIGTTPAISSLRTAKALEARIHAHHGHLGPRLAARALELGPDLRTRYQASLARWAREVQADTRLLSTCAAMEVAQGVCREVGVPEPQVDWRTVLRGALEESVVSADQGTRALDVVRDELLRNQGQYRGQERKDRYGNDIEPSGGHRGIWREADAWIGVYPTVLREILLAAEHDPAPILQLWGERNILICNRGQQFEVGVSRGQKSRVYAFRKEAVLG